MASPDVSVDIFDQDLIDKIFNLLLEDKSIVIHCRGGIGRAGLVAACILIKIKVAKSYSDAIKIIRSLRDPRAVESRKQEDYIKNYWEYLHRST